MYIPLNLPIRKPTLKPYHYDILAECKRFNINYAIELTETLIEAIHQYVTKPKYMRSRESFMWIDDSELGECCYEVFFRASFIYTDGPEEVFLECWDNCTHDFQYYLSLSYSPCARLKFITDDLPSVDELVRFVRRIDLHIADEVEYVEQAREDIVEMRALVYGEGW